MPEKTLIFSDSHLTAGDNPTANIFKKLCTEIAPKYDQVFILGDLFNTWLGDDLSIHTHKDLTNDLKNLSTKTNIYILHGNRDFLIGRRFEQNTGVKIVYGPYLLETNSKQYVLVHGDELCTDDIGYQRLKLILQNPLTKFIFQKLSKKMRLKLSGQLREKSIRSQTYKSREIMDVNPKTVQELMKKYPGANLIHGHTHRLNTHREKNFTRYVLGDWHETGNAISIVNSVRRLEID